jgi:hypothetical protein
VLLAEPEEPTEPPSTPSTFSFDGIQFTSDYVVPGTSPTGIPPEKYVKLAWDDPNPPERQIVAYRIYIRQGAQDWRMISATAANSGLKWVSIPLYQGQTYTVSVTAFNATAESDKSEPLTFTVPYVESKRDVQLVMNTTSGIMSMSFKGPENLLEANSAFFQYSTDLKTWTSISLDYYWVNGKFTVALPQNLGPRAFFRVGFEK